MKKINVLYICPYIPKEKAGADIINERNLNLLSSIEDVNLFLYTLSRKSKFRTLSELMMGYTGFLKHSDKNKISSLIKKNNIDIVFLWSSRIGCISEYIKKYFPSVKVITFFHNVEKQYYKEECRVNNSLKNNFIASVCANNEKKACDFSDYLITLNSRDADLVKKYYNRKVNLLLPTSFNDQGYDLSEKSLYRRKYPSLPLRLLFVGSNFFANREGLEWFIKEVMPHLTDCSLTIIGKGMDKTFKSSSDITVLGFVPSLKEYYYSSDIVISPIFSGGGMKTKTGEAMMFGLPILGTKESFVGYDLDYNKCGGIFENSEELINLIKFYKDSPEFLGQASEYVRTVFLEKYETSVLKKSLTNLINSAV